MKSKGMCVLSLSYLAHSRFMVLIFHCTFMKFAEDFSPRNEFDKKSKLFSKCINIFVPFCKIVFSQTYRIAIKSLKEMQFN